MKTGDHIRVTYCGQAMPATVMLASPNGASLLVAFDGALRDSRGGIYLGMMPLLRDDAGEFRDLGKGDGGRGDIAKVEKVEQP